MSELYFDIGADTSLVNKALDGLKSKLDGVFKTAAKKLNIDADGTKAAKLVDNLTNGTGMAVKNIDNLNLSFKNSAAEMDKVAGKTSIFEKAFNFNNLTNAVGTVSDAINSITGVGQEYESSLAAVGAITGLTGGELDKLGETSRNLAKQFGGSASDQLKSFQGILSKLGPDVAKDSAALELMAHNVNTLSKASGDDAAKSMNAIVDSMLQLGLASGSSMDMAKKSSTVMNALAASAKVGAAEIPQVADALLVAGDAAKGAGLDIVDVNAAIQVMAVGGKTGAEAGTALRNVLGFMQKASGPAAEAMQKMGFSSQQLGETLNNKGLPAALKMINDGMGKFNTQAEKNVALMDIFGTENSAAAGIMLSNLGKFDEFKKGIQDGITAQDAEVQAATRMATAEEQGKRIKAQIDDLKISLTNSIGTTGAAFAQIGTEIAPLATAFIGLAGLIPFDAIGRFGAMLLNQLVPNLFITNAETGALNFNFAALKASTLGQTVATYAQIVAEKARLLATNASAVAMGILNAVMSANPVTLIIIGIAGLSAGLIYLLSQMQPVQDAFKWMWEIIKLVGGLVGDWLTARFKELGDVINSVGAWISSTAKKFWDWITNLDIVKNSVAAVTGAFKWLKDTANGVFSFISNLAQSVSDKLKSVAKALGFKEEAKVNVGADTTKAVEDAKKIPEKTGTVTIPVKAELLSNSFKALQEQLKKGFEENKGALDLVGQIKLSVKNGKNIKDALKGMPGLDDQQRLQIETEINAAGGLDKYAKKFADVAAKNSKEEYKAKVNSTKNMDKVDEDTRQKNKLANEALSREKLKFDLELKREEFSDNYKREKQAIADNKKLAVDAAEDAYKYSIKNAAAKSAYDLALEKARQDEIKALRALDFKEREKQLNEFVKNTDTIEKLRIDSVKSAADSINEVYKQGYLTEKLIEEKKLVDLNLINENKQKTVLDFVKSSNSYAKALEPLQLQFKEGKIDLKTYQEMVQEIINTVSNSFANGQDEVSKAFQTVVNNANIVANKANKEVQESFAADKKTIALNQITDLAVLEREMSINEAEMTYKELKAKASGNRVLEKNAYEAFLIAKFNAEEKYRNSTISSMEKFGIEVIQSMSNAFSNVQFDFAVTDNKENNQKVAEDLKNQEKQLKDSLKNKEISYEEYVNKLNDLDKQREEQTKNTTNKLQDFWNTYNNFLSNIFKAMVDNNQKSMDAIVESLKNTNKRKEQIEIEQSKVTDKLSKEYFDLEQQKTDATKENTQKVSELYGIMATSVGISIADAFVSGKNLIEELPKILLDTLLKMIPVYIAQIYAKEIAAGSFAGIATASGLTVLLMSLVGAARAAVGAEDGVIGINQNYSKKAGRTDTIPLMVAPGESIIKASVTSKYGDLLTHLNKGGELADYGTSRLLVTPTIKIDNSSLVGEIRALKTEIKALKGNINRVETMQNVNVKTDIPKRINVVLQTNLHRG